MIIYIHNEELNQIEKYSLGLKDNMPYTHGGCLRVENFLGKTKSTIAWSSKKFLESFDQSFNHDDYPFVVKIGFCRGWQDVENGYFAHKLGTALDGGENLCTKQKIKLVKELESSNNYNYINQLDIYPTGIQFHVIGDEVNNVIPFPQLQLGSIGTAVFTLQDILWALGYEVCKLDGIYGKKTSSLVKHFQYDNELGIDGIVGDKTWTKLMKLIHPDDLRLNIYD